MQASWLYGCLLRSFLSLIMLMMGLSRKKVQSRWEQEIKGKVILAVNTMPGGHLYLMFSLSCKLFILAQHRVCCRKLKTLVYDV